MPLIFNDVMSSFFVFFPVSDLEIIFWGNSRNSNKVSLQQKRNLRTVLGINPLKYMQATF